ncbi:MAG: cephalosporin-C deacetylase-like acetyl esterase [Cyclobacteriaceae bacterium]|jgi:cephalosporin-C deacetylase-like acetyl esterase
MTRSLLDLDLKTIAVLSLFLSFLSAEIHSQAIDRSDDSRHDRSNNILTYLGKAATDITQNSLADIQTLQDWEKVRAERRIEFLEMMGLQDKPIDEKRTLPKVTKTGTIQKDGYRIEKLYYESLPNLFVPANLYIPDGIKKPVPAVLYVCGHSHTQKHHYQSHAKNFAQNGFVCLIIETIQRGEVKGEHLGQESLGWFQWYSRGYNPGGVEVWNGIRGLDLLSELPEVDKNRLGVTGISGGGSQSWYLPAADSRVKAAAAVAGAGSLEGQICKRTIDDHCDCMMPINTYGIDFSDIGALIAPRPFMITQTNKDLYYSLASVRDLHEKIKPIYSYYNKTANLVMVEGEGGHSYGSNEELRPSVLSFFMRELMGKDLSLDKIPEIDISKELSNEELVAYVNGIPENDITKTIQDSFVKLATPPEVRTTDDLETYRNTVVDFLKEKTFGTFPKVEEPLDLKEEFTSVTGGGINRKDYSFTPEEGWRLKISLQKSLKTLGPQPYLLVLKSPNEERYASASLSSGVRDKVNLAFFEARGIGETGWAPSLQWHIRRATAWTGRTIASMRVYDVLRCLEALRDLPRVDGDNISILAQGEMVAIASYAALLDGNIKSVIIKNPPATQDVASQPNGRGASIEMLNCLRVTDLPQVLGLMFPNEVVSLSELPSTYQWTEKLYKDLKRPNSFRTVGKLSDWMGPYSVD